MRQLAGLMLLIASGRFISFIARMNVVPFYPELMAKYDVGYTEIGALFSAFFVGYSLSLLPAGIMADRFSAMWQVIIGLLVLGISGVGTAFAPTFTHILVARGIQGFTVALVYTAILKLVASSFNREIRGKAVGLMEIATGLGMYTALTIFPILGGWVDYHWLLLSVPGLCALALFLAPAARRSHSGAAKPPEAKQSLRSVLSWDIFYITVTKLLALFAINGALGWISTHLVEVVGFSRGTAGLITGFVLISQMAAVFPAGWLSDRLGRRLPLVHIGSVLLTSAFIILLFARGYWVFPAVIMIGIGMAWGIAPLTVLVTEQFGSQHAGKISAFTIAIAQAGSGLAGVFFGWVLDVSGSFNVVWIVAAALSALRLLTASMIKERNVRGSVPAASGAQ